MFPSTVAWTTEGARGRMEPFERVQAALSRGPLDRVPMRLNARAEVLETLGRRLGVETREDIERRLGIDFRYVKPANLAPKDRGPFVPDNAPPRPEKNTAVSATGVVNRFHVWCPFANMREVVELDPFEDYRRESLGYLDPSPMAALIADINKDQRRFIGYKCGGRIFQAFKEARGVEQAMTDLILEPEFAHRFFEIETIATVGRIEKVMAAVGGGIDHVQYNDDLGAQTALMISPAMFREFLLPRYRRIFAAIRQVGASVFMHSCGAIRDVIPDLIDAGMNILNPVQTRATGMEPERLKRDFGDRITFCGGVDVQSTLPFGTPDDVRAEVISLIDTLGRGGGFVLDSSNLIQPDTPVENVMAMFDTGREYSPQGSEDE